MLDEWSHVQSKVRKGVIDTGWLSPVPWQLGRVFFIISLFLGFRFRSCVETVDPGMSCVCVCMYVTYAAVGLGGGFGFSSHVRVESSEPLLVSIIV